ncbi:hypothetical protein NP233_g2034 [Leucocoprinus birnbaumii]|uniref:Nephrocystin 3-like N-terminal domain-containing protein n=1 Tax=Leucocoprinus birnbaumii TaxID=56174 RepID=A0AAD5YV99_9AGAR|nr:hypothetical protein NP233_g2034 [Leucocoprinus birnbaumii]
MCPPQTPASATKTGLGPSQYLNPEHNSAPHHRRASIKRTNTAPSPYQDDIPSESPGWNQALNYPRLGGGNSPTVTLAPYSTNTHNTRNLSRIETHNVHNATFYEGSFAHARNIKINTAYMIDYNRTEDERSGQEARRTLETSRAEEHKVLKRLLSKAMPSAMLDSEDRGYVPRCDEYTRLMICNRILKWAQDHTLPHNLFWLSGPAAVGKSAVAQTVAETMKGMGLLGATFFFSRPNGRSDPSVVIPTLVLQLFTSVPEYRRIVSNKITQNPTVLQKNRAIQFQELIVEPFAALALANSKIRSNARDILLIVLDGLDECSDQVAQSDFVTIISRYTQSSSRLRFLISSRPKPHLDVVFSKAKTQAIIIKERLVVEDTEAKSDADRLLQTGFADIRSRYPNQLTDDWPNPAQMRLIADRALGLLGFVSFILRFIGDENYDDPSGQLEVCIKFLERSKGPEASSNPLDALDLLYTQILSDIPPASLPTTQRILALFIFYENKFSRSLCAQANFLGLSQASTYSALHRLHSVIDIPGPNHCNYPLKAYHSSFIDYLKDPARSGKFALDRNTLPPLLVITRSIEWLGGCSIRERHGFWRNLLQGLTWKVSVLAQNSEQTIQEITEFCLFSLWRISSKLPRDSLKDLMNILEKFDFNLDPFLCMHKSLLRSYFADFIRWVVTLGDLSASIVKVLSPDDTATETSNINLHHLVKNLEEFIAPFPHFTQTRDCIVYIKLGFKRQRMSILVVNLSTTTLMSKRRIPSDDLVGQTKIPHIQPSPFQNPRYEYFEAGNWLASNNTMHPSQTGPANTTSTGLRLSEAQSNSQDSDVLRYPRAPTIPSSSPPLPFQGDTRSESLGRNQAQAPNHPRLRSGNSPAVAPFPYSINTYGRNVGGSSFPTVAPQSQDAIHPGNSARIETHSVHNATFHKGSFAHARNIRIDTAYMIDYNRIEDEGSGQETKRTLEMSRAESEKRTEETKVLDKLISKATLSAMLDSEDRGYVPRCDEQTRLTIRNHIVKWAQDLKVSCSIFWLSGPAAVGKSAVAQTVAESMKAMGILGAVFFFSRHDGRSDPSAVIPTLVLQLFTSIPEYRRIVSDRITRDPTILQKNCGIQFQELIIEPFLTLADPYITSDAQSVLLIVLDGLDECSDRTAQSDFVEIISRHAQSTSRLRFLISSRPEPHLDVAFSKAETQAITIKKRLVVEDTEAQSDINWLLRKGFADIRSRYPNQLTDDWPAPVQMRLIAGRALGHLGFASFILRFIGDEKYDDPCGQLEACIRFLECSRESEASNPLRALDLLYSQILSDILSTVLPTTQCILAFMIFSEVMKVSLCAQANFLGLSQASTYSALHRLHSVVAIPNPSKALYSNLQVYHSSFIDYLKDPARSEKFALDRNILPPLSIIARSIEWLNCARVILGTAKGPGSWSQDDCHQLLPSLTWKSPLSDNWHMIEEITKLSLSSLWRTCPKLSEDSLKDLISLLERFDFTLDYTWWTDSGRQDGFCLRMYFASFIEWLVTLGASSASLIKVIIPDSDVATAFTLDLVLALKNFATPFPHYIRPSPIYSSTYPVLIRLGSVNPILLKCFVLRFSDSPSSFILSPVPSAVALNSQLQLQLR